MEYLFADCVVWDDVGFQPVDATELDDGLVD